MQLCKNLWTNGLWRGHSVDRYRPLIPPDMGHCAPAAIMQQSVGAQQPAGVGATPPVVVGASPAVGNALGTVACLRPRVRWSFYPPAPLSKLHRLPGEMPDGDNHHRFMSKQHWALVPSIFAPWILAVHFSVGPTVCYVCCLIPWL